MLTLITGRFRGKKLTQPPADLTRPTSNRTREAVFNCLFSLDVQLNGAGFLDGFAGSGAMGLEALSRGAAFCSFIENNPSVIKVLQDNITSCRLSPSEWEIKRSFDTLTQAYDIIYLDPPYGLTLDGKPAYIHIIESLTKKHLMKKECTVIIEISSKEMITHPPGLTFLIEKTYGAAKVGFYKVEM